MKPNEDLSPLLHRFTQALGMRIAAICHGDIASTEREVLACFPRMHIADEDLEKLSGPQVHRDRQAIVSPGGPRSLQTARVDDHKAQARG